MVPVSDQIAAAIAVVFQVCLREVYRLHLMITVFFAESSFRLCSTVEKRLNQTFVP